MNKIVCAIGSYDVGADAAEVHEILEPFRAEAERKLAEAFPDADVTVLTQQGDGQLHVDFSDWEEEERVRERVSEIVGEVWGRGDWHHASGRVQGGAA